MQFSKSSSSSGGVLNFVVTVSILAFSVWGWKSCDGDLDVDSDSNIEVIR